ncbi:amidohydrolase family protein [Egicoccus sp. AB-alg2]|uniref:amidohydrolase family protein n=1 Tax=Egicoccus sp. AB-alg2 TaxID=3242693 RepID=UPI00359D4A1A
MTALNGADLVVDVHAHALLPAIDDIVAGHPMLDVQSRLERIRNGDEAMPINGEMVRTRLPRLLELAPRLAAMDEARVDVQIVSPSPNQYHYWADPELARRICDAANASIAALVDQAPDRLVGIGMVPLQHPLLAAEILDEAVSRHGLVGVELSSHAPTGDGGTVELSDFALDEFWSRASTLDAVVLLHPFGCSLDARLDRYYLSNIVGQPVENAVALSHLIFSGVLDRFPDLRLIAAHGGGYLPTYLGRSDHGWQVRPDARTCEKPPSHYLRQIYFDSLVHTPDALRSLVAVVGAEHVLLGSDYPFDMGVENPVDRLVEAGLSDADVQRIASGNARDLGLLPKQAINVDRHATAHGGS